MSAVCVVQHARDLFTERGLFAQNKNPLAYTGCMCCVAFVSSSYVNFEPIYFVVRCLPHTACGNGAQDEIIWQRAFYYGDILVNLLKMLFVRITFRLDISCRFAFSFSSACNDSLK